jgi:hypothetical protein
MIDRLTALCLVGSVFLAGILLLEFRSGLAEPTALSEPSAKSATPSTTPMNEPAIKQLVATTLARPLFSATRRPPESEQGAHPDDTPLKGLAADGHSDNAGSTSRDFRQSWREAARSFGRRDDQRLAHRQYRGAIRLVERTERDDNTRASTRSQSGSGAAIGRKTGNAPAGTGRGQSAARPSPQRADPSGPA